MQYVPLSDNNNVKVLDPAPTTGLPAQVVDANFTALVAADKATQTALDAKQPSLGYTAGKFCEQVHQRFHRRASDTKYPSVKAVKTYVDGVSLSYSASNETADYVANLPTWGVERRS